MFQEMMNQIHLYVGGQRWLKRRFHPMLPEQVYRQVGDLRIYLNAKDFRGPSYYLMHGGAEGFETYEKTAKEEILSLLPDKGAVFLDIGANIGLFSLYAQRQKKDLKAYLFEPNPILSRCLQSTISNNQLSGFNHIQEALSSEPGEATFFIDALNDGGHSLLADQIEDNTGMSEVKVHLNTLDQIAEDKNLQKIDAIKIDVQGAEHMVLAGGRKTLERFTPPMLIECENISIQKIIDVLKSLDAPYKVRRMQSKEAMELDELIPIARNLHAKGVFYQDFLFFAT